MQSVREDQVPFQGAKNRSFFVWRATEKRTSSEIVLTMYQPDCPECFKFQPEGIVHEITTSTTLDEEA